jgi:hypothetical protein
MDSSTIELVGSNVEEVVVDGGTVRVRFAPAYIVKTLTGSTERTRWWQNGELVFGGAEVEGDLPCLPAICLGGDVGENVYTYRDMIPMPLRSRGHVRCDLRVEGSDAHIRVTGEAVELRMEDVPKYIEHVRAG